MVKKVEQEVVKKVEQEVIEKVIQEIHTRKPCKK